MIQVNALQKSFGRNQVLRGIDLTFPQGKVTAVLGPNGSGKTTLLKCILGMVMPDVGDIKLDGESIIGEWAYRSHLGYLPQIARFPDNLRVRELVRMVKDIRAEEMASLQDPQLAKTQRDGIPHQTLDVLKTNGLGEMESLGGNPLQREKYLLRHFALEPYLDEKLRHLSGGTRQKINILLAFMFDNPYYILDEPTAGLDPLSLMHFKELLRSEQQKGRTILLTTHIITLVEEIADEIIFLLDGRVYFRGTKEEMKEMKGGRNLEHAIAQMLEENGHV